MPYPIAPAETALARFFLVFTTGGRPVPFEPAGAATISLEPGDGNEIGPFYYRKKLPDTLIASGPAYRLLLAREQSSARCEPITLLVETRVHLQAVFQTEFIGTFTCAECDWDLDKGTVGIKVTTDDPYRLLTEGWDVEYNLLAVPDSGTTARRAVSATLAALSTGIKIEFLRIDANDEGDLDPAQSWGVFLRNTAHINSNSGIGGTNSRDVILFRYRRQNVPLVLSNGVYTAVNSSAQGWQVLPGSENPTTHTVDYVKTPEIAGFKTYQIKAFTDWYGNTNQLSNTTPYEGKYGNQLLLLPCDKTPADFGYTTSDYLKVTNPPIAGSQSLGGVQSDDHAPCWNVRLRIETNNLKSLWWRFGTLNFTRCIPLLDALHGLLKRTIQGPPPALGEPAYPVPASLAALLPPTPAQLSAFFSNPTNAATGETGDANELPRLLVSAASDVKRYGASEPATRLLISLKVFLADLGALYDVGAFVDPATGWLRIEHRSYLAARRATGTVLDLTTVEEAILPRAYTYRQQQLPRFEELTVANASTEDLAAAVSFRTAAIRYASDCANPREGQNRTTLTVSRVTGDVAALVLSGDAIPDNAVALLAPDTSGRLTAANRVVAPTTLLLRYHREGRVRAGTASVGLVPLLVASTRPGLEQAECSAPLRTLRTLDDATTQLLTSLGAGGIVGKAALNLKTGIVKFTPWLPTPEPTADAPAVGRQFSDQFSDQFA